MMETKLEKALNSILDSQDPPKRVPICHIKDVESFYNPKKKDTLCKFYLSGECQRGRDCDYSHSKELVKSQRYKT